MNYKNILLFLDKKIFLKYVVSIFFLGNVFAVGYLYSTSKSALSVVNGPAVHNGKADLRLWALQDVLPLNGEWQVFCNILDGRTLSRPTASIQSPYKIVNMPRLWNYGGTRPNKDGTFSGMGRATYRVFLYLPAHTPIISLQIPQILSASAIWIDGYKITSAGHVAAEPQDEIAKTPLTQFITLEPEQHIVTLAVEVSNHFHFEGGMSAPILIGTRDNLEKNREYRLVFDTGVFAALLILAFYIAAFGLTTQSSGWGWLLVLVISLSVRLGCTSGVFAQMFPSLSMSVLFRIEYLSIYVPWPIYFRLLAVMFPGHLHCLAGNLITAFAISGCLLSISTPVYIFTQFRDATVLFLIISAFYYVWCVSVAIYNREYGADVLGIGVVIFLFCVLHDGLMYAHWLSGIDVAPLGGLLLLLFHIIVLGQRFVKTLDKVKVLSSSLAALNNSLEGQVEERTYQLEQTITELHRAKELAEKEAVNKDRFLAHLSHEVRTPLNAIFGMTTLLLRDNPSEEQRRRLDLMKFSGAGLVRLLDDILEMSRLEAGRVKIAQKPFDLSLLCQKFADLMAERCHQVGLAFTYTFDVLPSLVMGDPDRIQQLLGNVTDNAIKFTKNGSIQFVVRATMHASQEWAVVFELTNSGPGIPPPVLGMLFQEFVRGPETNILPGSGLGLAIVKRLATAMGGQVSLDNIAGGSRFTFTLPVRDLEPERVTHIAEKSLPRFGLRILLVEDTPENRLVMQDMLATFDMHVTVAESGQKARELIENTYFDVMLLDMVLPDISGEEIAHYVTTHFNTTIASMPIIAVTANVIESDILRYHAVGIEHIVAKPVVLDELFKAISEVCGTALVNQGDSVVQEADLIAAGLPLFLQACQECHNALYMALETTDYDCIRRVAHRIRGSARTYGYEALGQLATIVEDGLREPSTIYDLSEAKCLLSELDRTLRQNETL
ncbi:ATP-binding protein [Acetobacter orientalis]|uniref:histidine kinase n=1 Tax=Acetobacter orientalis TaxID=146474 RepID=A0A0D6NI60_9PROT|nr:ATP-binding protein [Acetobacter orientalis]GAN65273.1 signal transduction histidine kinase [Acetobacter orientalis]GBR14785.1 signal transduction histidine kinase [Acetobacter orientalis NRIC 0481]GEL62273.1 histidine kinase [Acetobacter orientalis]